MFPAVRGSKLVCALCTFCMGCRCRFSADSIQCQKCTIFSCDECWAKCGDKCPVCDMLARDDASPIRIPANAPSAASADSLSSSSKSASTSTLPKTCACQECPGVAGGRSWSCHTCRQVWHTACKPDTVGHPNQCLSCYAEQMYADELRKTGGPPPMQLTRKFSSRAVHSADGIKIVSGEQQPTPEQSFAGFAVDLAVPVQVAEQDAGPSTFDFKSLDYSVHSKSSEERELLKSVVQRRNPHFCWTPEPLDPFGELARLSQEADNVPELTGRDLTCFDIANQHMQRGNLGPLAVREVRRALCCLGLSFWC